MSAPVPCGTCMYQWTSDEEFSPCAWCRGDYDEENEMYSEFQNYCRATNEDLLKNIPNMPTDEIAEVLAKLSRETRRDWPIQKWKDWLRRWV